jgi:hypothetical protein
MEKRSAHERISGFASFLARSSERHRTIAAVLAWGRSNEAVPLKALPSLMHMRLDLRLFVLRVASIWLSRKGLLIQDRVRPEARALHASAGQPLPSGIANGVFPPSDSSIWRRPSLLPSLPHHAPRTDVRIGLLRLGIKLCRYGVGRFVVYGANFLF